MRGGVLGLVVLVGCVERGTGDSEGGSTGGATEAEGSGGGTSGEPPGHSTTTGASTGEPTTGAGSTTGEGTEGTSSGGVGEGSSGSSGSSTGTTGEAVGFAADVWPIFAPRCGCHLDGDGAGKLELAKSVAYENLVGQPSTQAPDLLLVAPGAAEDSYLWHKLNNSQKSVGGTGKRMPPGGALDPAEIELVALWIDEGAAP